MVVQRINLKGTFSYLMEKIFQIAGFSGKNFPY